MFAHSKVRKFTYAKGKEAILHSQWKRAELTLQLCAADVNATCHVCECDMSQSQGVTCHICATCHICERDMSQLCDVSHLCDMSHL